MSDFGPMASYRDGKLDISVWKKQQDDKERYTLKLRRSYRDKNNEWIEQSINMFEQDIPRCILLLEEGYKCILEQKNN